MMKKKYRFRRLIIQIIFFFLQNPLLGNFFSGKIYQGRLKMVCTPGLNCHSCPAAVTSCPLGAMQFFLATKQSVSLWVMGFVVVVGAFFGRLVCGYVCPMGLLQDLLYRIKTPKRKMVLRWARYLKYLVLLLFVILLPLFFTHELSGVGETWFCKYICPSGIVFGAVPLFISHEFLRGMAGVLLVFNVFLTLVLLLSSVVVYRFFCRVFCPLGAIYSFFARFSFIRMTHDAEKCNSSSCNRCHEACLLAIEPRKTPNDPECVRCASCIDSCPNAALRYKSGLHHP